MRDVSHKSNTLRTAIATATVRTTPEAVRRVRSGDLPKGDPLPVAKVAAVQAAKATPTLIPYCHPVPVEFVGVDYDFSDDCVFIRTEVKAVYKTGVEMEALVAAAAAALNIYDILKQVEDDIEITDIRLVEKKGGKSDIKQSMDCRAAVVTVSDRASRGEYEDLTGPVVQELLRGFGMSVSEVNVVPDEPDQIRTAVTSAIENGARIVVTAGGTGVGERDQTPEALRPIFDRELPGVVQRILEYGGERTPMAMLSRAACGIVGSSVVLVLPGSPMGATDGIKAVFPGLLHAIEVLDGDAHMVKEGGSA